MDSFSCEGDGMCLTECECANDCICFVNDHGHLKSATKRFCINPTQCKHRCVLKDCSTFNYCHEEYPAWYYTDHILTTINQNGNQCNGCGIFKVKFPNEKGDCFVCYENKYLIETYCNHRFCLDCLIQINPHKESDNPCPFCNQHIEFNKLK
jgi:hypothetical protein